MVQHILVNPVRGLDKVKGERAPIFTNVGGFSMRWHSSYLPRVTAVARPLPDRNLRCERLCLVNSACVFEVAIIHSHYRIEEVADYIVRDVATRCVGFSITVRTIRQHCSGT